MQTVRLAPELMKKITRVVNIAKVRDVEEFVTLAVEEKLQQLDQVLHVTQMSESELRQEMAILLFGKEKLTLGQASRLCNMSQLQFQHLLASRQIPLHYDVSEFEQDLETLRGLGRL